MIEFLSERVKKLEPSAIQAALQRSSNPDVISFSLGMPSDNLLPPFEYKRAMLDLWMPGVLQYSPPLEILKEQIAEIMKQRGVVCSPSQIFLTTGAQQAISLLSRLLAEENDNIIAEEVTYPGFTQAIQLLGLNLLTIPVSFTDGMDISSLEDMCKKSCKPKFIYTMSEGHNPLGLSFNKEKRLKLVEIAQTYQIPLIEDDAYGFLNYGPVNPPLKAYGGEWVFYIGSFSKILAPSARVGWVIAPESIITKLEILKEGSDINTATFSQRVLSSFLERKDFTKHLLILRATYKEKRDEMVKALNHNIPELKFREPQSGFFVWGQLPAPINTQHLFWHALKEEKVSFLPGASFAVSSINSKPSSSLSHCLRLSFSHCPLNLIETGVKRLANALKTYES